MTTREAVEALEPNHLMKVDFMSDEDYEGNKHNYEQLRVANSRIINELTQMGMQPDFTLGMLSTYFDGLVAVGVITKAQLLIIQLGWENAFHKQLQAMHTQATEMIATLEARQKLAVPGRGGGRGVLHVPGGRG